MEGKADWDRAQTTGGRKVTPQLRNDHPRPTREEQLDGLREEHAKAKARVDHAERWRTRAQGIVHEDGGTDYRAALAALSVARADCAHWADYVGYMEKLIETERATRPTAVKERQPGEDDDADW
jgi:hypothetical protein